MKGEPLVLSQHLMDWEKKMSGGKRKLNIQRTCKMASGNS